MLRLTETSKTFAHLLLLPFELLAFVLVVGVVLTPIAGVGIPLLLVGCPLLSAVAAAHRYMAASTLRRPVQAGYLETPSGTGLLGTLRTWATDPGRWRELGWVLVSWTAGAVLSLLVLSLFLGVLFYLIYPALYAVTPEGVFDDAFGLFRLRDAGEAAIFSGVMAVVSALLWWVLALPLTRLRARLDAALLSVDREAELQARVQQVSESRAQTVDFSAAEMRRIERDLHDGAQARLVALTMQLGLADELMARDPEQARRLIDEARNAAGGALGDLRTVVRGIHPPVLADRGLVGAVQALAVDLPLPVEVQVGDWPQRRLVLPLESALYFAVAEGLTNAVRHADARHAWVTFSLDEHEGDAGNVTLVVGDDGRGGADPGGSGLQGLARRLGAFDGRLEVTSPPGGPTRLTMEVPCAWSSPRTTPSSGTA